MTDADALAALLAQRRQTGADHAAIDAAIFSRFGRVHAVMFTDLVGFSRVVEAFGIVHFLQLIQESEALFIPLIQQHGGTCLKHEGDSLLVVFDAPQQALDAARAMVDATVALNPGRAPEERIEICIGLGYGTVLRIDDNEVWGAGGVRWWARSPCCSRGRGPSSPAWARSWRSPSPPRGSALRKPTPCWDSL